MNFVDDLSKTWVELRNDTERRLGISTPEQAAATVGKVVADARAGDGKPVDPAAHLAPDPVKAAAAFASSNQTPLLIAAGILIAVLILKRGLK